MPSAFVPLGKTRQDTASAPQFHKTECRQNVTFSRHSQGPQILRIASDAFASLYPAL